MSDSFLLFSCLVLSQTHAGASAQRQPHGVPHAIARRYIVLSAHKRSRLQGCRARMQCWREGGLGTHVLWRLLSVQACPVEEEPDLVCGDALLRAIRAHNLRSHGTAKKALRRGKAL
jgi:hypothetical protein